MMLNPSTKAAYRISCHFIEDKKLSYSYIMHALAGKRNQINWKAWKKRDTVHQKSKLLHVELTIRSCRAQWC